MNSQLKAEIHKAIEDVIENNAENNMWDGWIHNGLYQQMTDAAEAVFDSAMAAQKFAEEQSNP